MKELTAEEIEECLKANRKLEWALKEYLRDESFEPELIKILEEHNKKLKRV